MFGQWESCTQRIRKLPEGFPDYLSLILSHEPTWLRGSGMPCAMQIMPAIIRPAYSPNAFEREELSPVTVWAEDCSAVMLTLCTYDLTLSIKPCR